LDLANGTKAKIRNIMSALFQHALRHQFLSVNPTRGQWQDVDADKGVLSLRQGVVKNNVTELKTKASRRPVPIDPALVMALQSIRQYSAFAQPNDWVFASPDAKGKVPLWPCGVMQTHVRAAVRDAGITKSVGWHTFRHSYATLLKGNGEDVKTVQESLRHATFQVTMDVYTQAIPAALRSAQAKVVAQITDGRPLEAVAVSPLDPYWTMEGVR
jgi:integrase